MNEIFPVDNQVLLQFLRRWHGDPTSPHASVKEPSTAPQELIDWHEISAQWNGAITSHNYAIPLPELEPEGGMIPFWVENQGTWLWAFDPNDKNHLVYEREPSEEPGPWTPTGETLSDFLIHATVLEQILGAPARKTTERADAEFIHSRKECRQLPFPAWNWPAPGSQILLGDDWLALVHPSGDPEAGYDITLAAADPEDIAWAENVPGIKWRSYFDSRDSSSDEPLPW